MSPSSRPFDAAPKRAIKVIKKRHDEHDHEHDGEAAEHFAEPVSAPESVVAEPVAPVAPVAPAADPAKPEASKIKVLTPRLIKAKPVEPAVEATIETAPPTVKAPVAEISTKPEKSSVAETPTVEETPI